MNTAIGHCDVLKTTIKSMLYTEEGVRKVVILEQKMQVFRAPLPGLKS